MPYHTLVRYDTCVSIKSHHLYCFWKQVGQKWIRWRINHTLIPEDSLLPLPLPHAGKAPSRMVTAAAHMANPCRKPSTGIRLVNPFKQTT